MLAQTLKIGVIQHNLTLFSGKRQMKEMLRGIKWNLREEAKTLPSIDEWPTLNHVLVMNVLVWNCRGALKLSFQNHVRELVFNHNPVILLPRIRL